MCKCNDLFTKPRILGKSECKSRILGMKLEESRTPEELSIPGFPEIPGRDIRNSRIPGNSRNENGRIPEPRNPLTRNIEGLFQYEPYQFL